ncbi:hypothetical protein R1sor_008216 [Riccia sorocarpa]|uniref:Uncharacterized protein n=1 Tax=Riccia sorocarpa TaxID=122646 RepID=A0ABD3HWT3_9MARC
MALETPRAAFLHGGKGVEMQSGGGDLSMMRPRARNSNLSLLQLSGGGQHLGKNKEHAAKDGRHNDVAIDINRKPGHSTNRRDRKRQRQHETGSNGGQQMKSTAQIALRSNLDRDESSEDNERTQN